jgi:sugar lactone lactonase YvrE
MFSNSAGARHMVTLPTPRYVLGEGPVWTPDTGRLSWIDIDHGLVMSAPFGDGRLGEVTTLEVGGPVGCAIPISGGRFLVSLEAWLGILHPDGRLEKSRALIPANRRFNDGKIDPQGRLVVGSLRRWGGPDGNQVLVRLEHDGTLTVLDDRLNLSNGLGWSPDGQTLYHADSSDRVVYARSYAGGAAGERQVFAKLEGMPDGLTIDADGNLWVTLLDRSRVDCYSPVGARRADRTVDLPGLHPASVEFAGPGLDELVITTGFPRLENDRDRELRTEGDGALVVVDVGATGVAPTPWVDAPLPR